ncbi:unnamed protein product [Orchesella dallaii]|uniref:Serine/threonine-protein phosphatase 1 regulatory subunit 10 n=1 Tax=Orchesella dallaii TaxID=48710 RepID=A0ABP1S4V8_9HEXA
MPRIDPERLLKCLQPLLEATSGAIKSIEEVDKILGLMSKFSKKLVSKCIYINILNSTNDSVLDLFMQRGGWSLVFGWANDSVNSKNYSLLKEIVTLLLRTPTTLQRLRENKFPILIKSLSKDCEDEETRNLAKQVVAKWIIVAKGGEVKSTVQPITQSVGIPMQVANINFSIDQNIPLDQRSVQDLGNIGGMNADSLLNIDPTFMPDAENQLMDFDISHNDLPDIDFNLDILSKVVDPQNLDLPAAVTAPLVDHKPAIVNMEVVHQNNTIPTVPSVIPMQPIKEEVIEMLQVQPAPKIFIKTIAGQRTVSLQSLPPIPPSTPEGQYCVIIKDGRNYLMRLKDDTKPIVTGVVPEPLVPEKHTENRGQDTADSKEKRKQLKNQPLSSPNKAGQSSGMKTYPPSAKANNPIVQEVNKKNVDQSSKLDGKDKEKKHSKEKSGDGHKKSKSSSSNSKASAAAVLAKKQEDDEKLREEIRKQKALMKKRQKEAVKQKQQEKDQETLKKLNLAPSTTSPSGSMKIPKIPKKSTSFADAIGIPGVDGAAPVDKIKKVSPEKGTSKSEDNPIPPSPTKKFYGKEEPEASEDKPKERRHKAKVFVSSKSKSDDLLKAMTESGKSKTNKEKEKVKEKEEVKTNNVGLGNSIPAVPPPPKVSKRLSTETIEKPGDSKKIKLSDSKSEKLKDKESKDAAAAAKEKERKKASAIALKESSLFMDMLNASSDVTKPSKRKRRPSIGSEKDKNDPESPVEKSKKLVKEEMDSPSATPDIVLSAEEPAKPVFNFYRDTLNDSEEENKESDTKSGESTSNSASDDRPPEGEEGSFTPQDNDGKLKSALCLHRSKTKPKKSVRWRQEDELKEFHFFEMDETERVNVTKQKDFTEMSQNEKAIEKTGMLRRKAAQEEEQRNEWKLVKIKFNDDILQPNCSSQERFVQEEREKNVLGLFLPPGSILPETAIEPDTTIPVERNDPRPMPVEDVIGITKVCDYRTKKWPAPVGFMGYGSHGSGHSEVEDIPQNHSVHSYQPTPTPDYNPWNASANLGFNVNVPPVGVPNMVDMTAFQQFAPPAMNVNLIGTAPPPPMFPNPFAYPPPPLGTGPPPGLDGFGVNQIRDNRLGHPPSNRGGRFNEADQRRNFHNRDGGRDRVGNRDRDYRDDRGVGGRDRERDRDYRRRDRDNNDRDHRHLDRDRNNRDFRPGNRNIRKDIPCRYYKKGFCQNGSRCEFSHDASNNLDENRSNAHSRDTFDSGRSNRSPDSGNDVDLRQEMNSRDSWNSERQNSSDEPDATSFALPPSSPTEPEVPGFGPATESTKVIPV